MSTGAALSTDTGGCVLGGGGGTSGRSSRGGAPGGGPGGRSMPRGPAPARHTRYMPGWKGPSDLTAERSRTDSIFHVPSSV